MAVGAYFNGETSSFFQTARNFAKTANQVLRACSWSDAAYLSATELVAVLDEHERFPSLQRLQLSTLYPASVL